jgi:hypothetical protein
MKYEREEKLETRGKKEEQNEIKVNVGNAK